MAPLGVAATTLATQARASDGHMPRAAAERDGASGALPVSMSTSSQPLAGATSAIIIKEVATSQAPTTNTEISPEVAASIGLATAAILIAIMGALLLFYVSKSRRKRREAAAATPAMAEREGPSMHVCPPYELTPECTPQPNKGYFELAETIATPPSPCSATFSPYSSVYSPAPSSTSFTVAELDSGPTPPTPTRASWMGRKLSIARSPWL